MYAYLRIHTLPRSKKTDFCEIYIIFWSWKISRLFRQNIPIFLKSVQINVMLGRALFINFVDISIVIYSHLWFKVSLNFFFFFSLHSFVLHSIFFLKEAIPRCWYFAGCFLCLWKLMSVRSHYEESFSR